MYLKTMLVEDIAKLVDGVNRCRYMMMMMMMFVVVVVVVVVMIDDE